MLVALFISPFLYIRIISAIFRQLEKTPLLTHKLNRSLIIGEIVDLYLINSVQFSRFLFPPLVEQNTHINIITLRKKGHATKRNNVETCRNSNLVSISLA